MTPTEKLITHMARIQTTTDAPHILLATHVLNDIRFPSWSGSGKYGQHHYGYGGLAQHVLEVFEIALQVRNYHVEGKDDYVKNYLLSEEKVFLACIYHDAGKMWDYQPVQNVLSQPGWAPAVVTDYSNWEKTQHSRNIHHVSRSASLWSQVAKDVNSNFFDEILHAILSHHGQRAWGSPVAPNSRLAWLLHLSDSLSARLDDCDTFDGVK